MIKYIFYFLLWLVLLITYSVIVILRLLWDFKFYGYENYHNMVMSKDTYHTKKDGYRMYISPKCIFTHLKWLMKYGLSGDSIEVDSKDVD